MRLFELHEWVLSVREECWALLPFKKILKRDKSRNKDMALKEMLFIYYYTDIKSDYLIITDEKIRETEIKKDIELPDNWKIDSVMQEAIDFYESKSISVVAKLYKSTLKAVDDISKYLENTDALLTERTNNGGTVTKIQDITGSLAKVPNIMKDLKSAYKEVVKEQEELEGRMKGAQKMGIFEGGLGNID